MDIMNMKVDEILLFNDLAPIAREAKEASKIIHTAYQNGFGIGVDKIEVWQDRDGYNFEYLTHDGIWQARYLHQKYDIKCTPDEIFKLFRAKYILENDLAQNENLSELRNFELISRYFSSFVNRTKRMLAEKQ